MIFLYRDPEGKKLFARRSLETSLARSVSLGNRCSVKGKKKDDAEVATLRQRVIDLESILLQSTTERDAERKRDFLSQSVSLYYNIQQRRYTRRAETDESYLSRDDGESEQKVNRPQSHSTIRFVSTGEQDAVTEPIPSPSRTTESPNGREVEVIPSSTNTLSTE